MMRGAPLVLVLALVACRRPDPDRVVKEWLLCEECNGDQLARLLDLGDRAVEPLVRALTIGPKQAQVDNVAAQARSDAAAAARFRARSPGAAAGAPPLDPDAAAAATVAGYRSTYRHRAILGLDRIGTMAALDSLRAIWARDSSTSGLDSVTRERLRAASHGVSGISLAVVPALTVGQIFQAVATVRRRPGVQFVITWVTTDPNRATVSASGQVTALAVGAIALRACVAGLPAICAITPLRIP